MMRVILSERNKHSLKGAVIVVTVLSIVAVASQRIGDSQSPEAKAISTVRAIQSAESKYAAVSGGYFDILECLRRSDCDSRVQQFGPFVEPRVAEHRELDGYRFAFHPGVPTGGSASRTATRSFAVTAIPVSGRVTKYRTFCGDDRNLIYASSSPTEPEVKAGRCADTTGHLR